MKKITVFALLTAFVLALSLTGCGSSSSSGSSGSNSSTSASSDSGSSQASSSKSYTLGSTVDFDDLSIAFGDTLEFTTLDNQYSELNGRDVVVIPVTITNNSKETHGLNMFYVNAYGSSGTKLDSVEAYFDDGLSTFDDMRTGASLSGHFYMLYDGDGDYVIELDKLVGDKTEVTIPVKKA